MTKTVAGPGGTGGAPPILDRLSQFFLNFRPQTAMSFDLAPPFQTGTPYPGAPPDSKNPGSATEKDVLTIHYCCTKRVVSDLHKIHFTIYELSCPSLGRPLSIKHVIVQLAAYREFGSTNPLQLLIYLSLSLSLSDMEAWGRSIPWGRSPRYS